MSSRTFQQIFKKIAFFVVIIVLFVMIKNISFSILSSLNRTKTVEDLQQALYEKKQEQKYLTQKHEIEKSDSFVEEEARTKLGMTREGEKIVIDEKVLREKQPEMQKAIPNWQKWLQLFANRS